MCLPCSVEHPRQTPGGACEGWAVWVAEQVAPTKLEGGGQEEGGYLPTSSPPPTYYPRQGGLIVLPQEGLET